MLDLLEKLINISSLTGEEGELGCYLENLLREQGYRVERQQVGRDRFNLLARLAAEPVVLLSTHLDTVAPHFPARRRADRLWGRGACDAKGSIVAMLEAGRELLARDTESFALLFVVGEEAFSDGAKTAAQMQLNSRYVIIGEPTENKLAAGQKGSLVFRLEARGVAGHSAYPEIGDSALHRLIRLLERWLDADWGRDDLLGESTLNIGVIQGGDGANVIAAGAEAEGIFRVAGSIGDIRRRIDNLLENGIDFQVRSASEPQHLAVLPGFEQTVVSFGSDAAHLRPLGEILLCGPGSVRYAHGSDEQISAAELDAAVKLYVSLVQNLLQQEEEQLHD